MRVFLKGSNLLKEPSSKASKCHPSSILESSRDKQNCQAVIHIPNGGEL